MSDSLFAIIVSFPFIFIYTCSFEFIVIFYLIYVMFLFVGHSDRSSFLRCCTARSSTRLLRSRWLERPSRRLPRRRLTWSRSPPRSTRPVRRLLRSRRDRHPRTMMRRVPSRGETSSRCDVQPLSKDGQSLPRSLRSAITEVMMHNTSHTRR
jgi:hypothetical protein